MRSGSQVVKIRVNGQSQEVGTATYPIFDSVREAETELGEEKTLELINAQVRTNEMNRVRGLARGEPSKNLLRQRALAKISFDEWQAVAGNLTAIEALLEQKIEEVREELRQQRQFASVSSGDGDDEDQD